MPKFVQSNEVAWNFLGDNIVAFNLAGDKQFHDLNATAALVFKLLQTPKDKSELVAAVLAEFDVNDETASTDVEALLAEMHGKGLITEA